MCQEVGEGCEVGEVRGQEGCEVGEVRGQEGCEVGEVRKGVRWERSGG